MMSASKARKHREDHVGTLAVLMAQDCTGRRRLAAILAVGLLVASAQSVIAQTSSAPAAAPNNPSEKAPPGATSSGITAPKDAPPTASPGAGSASDVKPATPSFGGDSSEPTPQHIEKARQLILATGISRSFQIIIPEFMAQIGSSLTQSRPELIDDMNKVLDQLRPEFDKQSDEMIDQSARIYAKLLSEKDIDAVLAFFNSEAGRRYVGAQPQFLNQLVSGMQAWQQKISATMMTRVREEMKKKGHDL